MTDPRQTALDDQHKAACNQARMEYTLTTKRGADEPCGKIMQHVVDDFAVSVCCMRHTQTCPHLRSALQPAFGHANVPNMLLCRSCWGDIQLVPEYCSFCFHELNGPGYPDAGLVAPVRVHLVLCGQCHAGNEASKAGTP